jgi:hypothetical protein
LKNPHALSSPPPNNGIKYDERVDLSKKLIASYVLEANNAEGSAGIGDFVIIGWP